MTQMHTIFITPTGLAALQQLPTQLNTADFFPVFTSIPMGKTESYFINRVCSSYCNYRGNQFLTMMTTDLHTALHHQMYIICHAWINCFFCYQTEDTMIMVN